MFNRSTRMIIILLIVLGSFQAFAFASGGRTPVYAENGMVVCQSRIAAETGREILRQGGNAIDAAVATALSMAVTWPSAGNIGGGGFIVYHGCDGETVAFDFREKAPTAATPDMYIGSDGGIRDAPNRRGLLATGVPGTVAGLVLAHRRFGKLPWKTLVAPAIRLARKGFPFSWALHNQSRRFLRVSGSQYAATKEKMFKDGKVPFKPGENWRQPDLAETLKRIQKQGHDGFYRGKTAKRLAAFMKAHGGVITEEDMAVYRAIERRPIHGTYRGYDVYSMCPPSSGGTILVEMLNILEGFDLKAMGHNSAEYLHILTEVMRRAYADRAQHLGDPDFNPDMPIERLISKAYARILRESIDPKQASVSDSASFNQPFEGTQTTHISVVDAERNAVALTYTLEQGYGTGIVAEGLGFFLNNEMGDFNPIPGRTDRRGLIGTPPNRIEPEKRMLSSMSPTILAKDGKPVFVIGSPGGRTIINTVLQVILNFVDHGMDVARSVEAGRIHHQWLPDVTMFEKWLFSPDTIEMYRALGHEVRIRSGQGCANGIFIDHERGILNGAADPRSPDGDAVGY